MFINRKTKKISQYSKTISILKETICKKKKDYSEKIKKLEDLWTANDIIKSKIHKEIAGFKKVEDMRLHWINKNKNLEKQNERYKQGKS